MPNYIDTRTNQVQTEALIKLRGLPIDRNVLASIGIYPVEYPYPAFDRYTQEIKPVGKPVPKDGNPKVYVQAFEVVQLSDERLADNLTRLAEEKRQAALASADEAVAAYMAMFSDVERATWPTQQAEVNAYLADNKAPTPTLDGLAQARGVAREEMLQKAIAKVKAFEPLSVAIVGRQQSYEDAIKATAADTSKTVLQRIAALKAMSFDYSDIMAMAAAA